MNQKRGRAFIINVCKDSFYLAGIISPLWWIIPFLIAHKLEMHGFEKILVFALSIIPLYFASLLIVLPHESKKMLKKQFESVIYKFPLLVQELNRIDKNILKSPPLIFRGYSGIALKYDDIHHLADTEEEAIRTETQETLRKALANSNKRKSFLNSLMKNALVISVLISTFVYFPLTHLLPPPIAVSLSITALAALMLIILISKYFNADGPEFDYKLDS